MFLSNCNFITSFVSSFQNVWLIKNYANELLFLFHNIVIASAMIISSRFGRQGLTAYIVVCWILANFLVLKQVTMFGTQVITTDGFAIGLNSALLLLSSYYGPKAGRQTIKICMFMVFFFLVMSQIHRGYIPSLSDVTDIHYSTLFSYMPRVIGTSLFGSMISTNFNLILFGFFSYVLAFLPRPLIHGICLVVSQVLDTILFAFLALYGTVSSLTGIIIFSSCVKIAAIGINVILIAAVQHYFPKPYDVV